MDAVTTDMLLVLAILLGAIALFVTEVVRIDVAAILVMVVVGLSGLIPTADVFAGFSSNAVISIIAVMILGAGLDRVGVMRTVAAWLLKVGGSTERRILASTSLAVGSISAFMQNIGAAALFLPVVERISDRTKVPSSRLLMPMGFAAILGGTLTLVASGPLILLNDLLASTADNLGIEIEPFGLFAPTPIGAALLLAGITLFAVAGRWLLPAAKTDRGAGEALPDIAARYGLDGRLRAAVVSPDSPLVGRQVEQIEQAGAGVLVAALAPPGEDPELAPPREHEIVSGTVLGLTGPAPKIEDFAAAQDLEWLPADRDPFVRLVDPAQAGLVEVAVRPGSDAVGQQVRALRLRVRFGAALLAVHHRGGIVTENLREHQLGAGDVLVLFGPWERMRDVAADPSLVVISDYPTDPPRTNKRWWALAAFVTAISLVIFTGMQLSLALMVGAIGVLLSGVLTPDEAYRAVSWKTVFLLAALIPLGQAVEETGTAAWIAEGVITATVGLPGWAILATVGVLTTVFTLVVSNVGATVLLVPLAANVAVGVGANPATYALMVAIAASNAFLLPTHQVNALLMGPGGYRVVDYVRAGTAMSVLFLVIAVPMLLWLA
ncbi:MAG: SLC13 family permease [Nitriliruptoraceae bacterium]